MKKFMDIVIASFQIAWRIGSVAWGYAKSAWSVLGGPALWARLKALFAKRP